MQARLRAGRRLTPYAGVACPRCARPLEAEGLSSGTLVCPRCRRPFEAVRFTPPERRVEVASVEDAGLSGATACGAHRRNAAVATCSRCGIFMCALCRTDSDGILLCAACFDRLLSEGALDSARTSFTDHWARASSAAALGLVFCMPLGILLGPLALYYGVRGFAQPAGTLGTRGGIVVAMLLGLFETLMGLFLLGSMLAR